MYWPKPYLTWHSIIIKPKLISSMSTYQAPSWIHAPFSKWKLDEIKNGVIVDSLELDAPLVTFGRAAEVDVKGAMVVYTAHESCSRLHARIAFDSQGMPWLKDLGSGNGTKGMFNVCVCYQIMLIFCYNHLSTNTEWYILIILYVPYT